MIELKILNPEANLPEYATEFSAGIDLVAILEHSVDVPPLKNTLIHTGLSINMMTVPNDMMAIIVPRSGKGHKEGKVLGNSVGIIDQDYHGELMVSVLNRNSDKYITIEPGERIAQLIFVPVLKPQFKVVDEFSETTERGIGGFGSTGG